MENSLHSFVAAPPPRHSRLLLGVFTADDADERRYRAKFRALFQLHPQVCDLKSYTDDLPKDCRLVYTFVVGGASEATPPVLLQTNARPWLVSASTSALSADLNEHDVTLLNIRENMNEGKSQTWFAYAASQADALEIDYIGKVDTDTILHLDQYFAFCEAHMPPPPYNRHILAGLPADKLWWEPKLEDQPKEKWWRENYGRVLHLYVQGQFYFMSSDLAKVVADEAASADYIEFIEDHDISSMAFHSFQPVHLVVMQLEQRFWQHRVKLSLGAKWEQLWGEEMTRLVDVLTQQHLTTGERRMRDALDRVREWRFRAKAMVKRLGES